MALKCAVELRIADIIHSHGGAPITLSQIASCIDDSPSPDIPYLSRIMRLLVRKNIFTVHHPLSDSSSSESTLYGLNHVSRWLLHGSDLSLTPMILMENHPWVVAPWHCLSTCVKEGGTSAFEKAHGRDAWDFASQNPEFNNMLNDGMACTSRIITRAILTGYKDGFGCIGSLVDVGGGTGTMVAEIVKSHPHIKATNFDLPHVIATAPLMDGVCHVGGDMFKEIPSADAVFMKWILHDWSDEDFGGGTGGIIGTIAEIVKTYPHIEGINFDLPRVVATAPDYDGASHVGGNMFESIPNADAAFHEGKYTMIEVT
ncbi:hypothetical protein LWI29_018799 [Acer saccharum]|uniref:Uncharacterized protein n=1 Tax=Acer saccharum TaxID=4024 RepID=A0AA39VR02_ACESA|nr:hypothetical protein LWI29_018799 [Acer saccharum]